MVVCGDISPQTQVAPYSLVEDSSPLTYFCKSRLWCPHHAPVILAESGRRLYCCPAHIVAVRGFVLRQTRHSPHGLITLCVFLLNVVLRPAMNNLSVPSCQGGFSQSGSSVETFVNCSGCWSGKWCRTKDKLRFFFPRTAVSALISPVLPPSVAYAYQ